MSLTNKIRVRSLVYQLEAKGLYGHEITTVLTNLEYTSVSIKRIEPFSEQKNKMVNWCERNCPNKNDFYVNHDPTTVAEVFWFSDPSLAMLFRLSW